MEQKELNTREEQLNDFGGGGGAHKPAAGSESENDSRDYGKWALVATAIVLAAVAVVLWIL